MSRPLVPNLLNLGKEEIVKFFATIDNFVADCDGVLWNQTGIISGSRKFVNRIQESGKKLFYMTNNSFRSREEFIIRANSLGFKAEREHVLCTPYLAAKYLNETGLKNRAYVIGTNAITDELKLVGIGAFGTGPEELLSTANEYVNKIKIESDIGAVVVGFDFFFSFPKIVRAATYLQNPDCAFIVTGLEERFQNKENVIPGPGCFTRAIEKCSRREPFLLGKPSSYVEKVMAGFQLDPNKTLLIGDSCTTDIALGSKCRYKTLLVLSGVSDIEDIKKWQEASQDIFVPDAYVEKLGDLLPFIN